jgi:hypothetical protein
MQIDESDEHAENANDSMRESLEPDSNVTLQSAPQQEKQKSPTTSTGHGMQIDESDEQNSKARHSRPESLEPHSNVTLESARHS